MALYNRLKNSIYELIDQAEKDPEFAVHEIRKKLKMIRAFLKMVKPGLSGNQYDSTNIHFRNIGRILSEIRDAHSRREILNLLEPDLSDESLKTLFSEMKAENRKSIDDLEQTHYVDFNIFQRVKKKLDSPTSDPPFKDLEFTTEMLIEGVSVTYESGFNSFFTSRLCSTPELLHEWRKRVKDLQSQALYINDVSGLASHIDINELNELADQLGEIQDFNISREWMSTLTPHVATKSDIDRLSDLLKARQEKLLKTIEYLGKNIYRLEPERFKLQLQSLFR